MEQLRQDIVDILNCDENTATAVITKLTELGVTSVDDLVEVQVSDLTPVPLQAIPARKLVRRWSTRNSQPESAGLNLNFSTGAASPVSDVQPSTSAGALPSVCNTPLATDNYASNWAFNFDVRKCISQMANDTNTLVRKAAQNLTSKQILPHSERNEVIRYVADAIRNACSTPSRKSLNVIAEVMVSSYQQLRDEVGGEVIGPGYLSIRNQLENRMSYLKRPQNIDRKLASARRRINLSNVDEDLAPKKRMRDGYGCIDFLPVCLPDGETSETLIAKQHQLKEIFNSNSWSQTEVTELMTTTYIHQRQDLVGDKPLTVREILKEWPFFCQPRCVFHHLVTLLGVNIIEKLNSSVVAKADTLVKFFSSVAPTRKEVGQKLSQFSITTQPVIGVLNVLLAYFGESESVLFRGFEVTLITVLIA